MFQYIVLNNYRFFVKQPLQMYLVVLSIFYQFYFIENFINLMKKDAYFQMGQYSNDPLKQKEKIFINSPQSQVQMYSNLSKKSIAQNNNFQPVPIQPKSLLTSIKSQDYTTSQANKLIQSVQNPQKIKSSSVHEKIPKSSTKFQYLAYVQRQYKQQKEKKVNFTSIIESQHRLKDDLQQIKSKLETYYQQLQKKDQLIVKKEKQVLQTNKKLQLAIQKIQLLEYKCKQLQQNNDALYNQCLRYQQNQDYNIKLFDNYSILSQKCSQIEQILQQKDAYIENIITSKTNQYNSAINTKNHEIKALEERISILQGQNSQLITTIKNKITSQKPVTHSQEYDASKFQIIGQQFEAKVNFYINQNTRLKNVIGNYEGQVEQLKVQLRSLQSTLKAYEDRDKLQKVSKIQEQLLLLQDALEYEKMEKDELISQHELEIFKLENLISEKRLESEGSLISLFDKERLHESLYLALEDVARLNKKLNEAGVKA